MARRQRESDFELTVKLLAKLPWQVCIALAPFAYLVFHRLALLEAPQVTGAAEIGGLFNVMIFRTAGLILQYLAPLALFVAALVSWLSRRKRATLLAQTESRTASAPLLEMSWRQFEQLVGAHFERLGYSVDFTSDGADGGIDVIARKGRESFVVQCKQWRATQVGVSVVRELFGVMAARGAAGAFVVSIGPFTRDAQAFAEGRNITLVDANTILAISSPEKTEIGPSAPRPSLAIATSLPHCPRCGASMVRRIAKQGNNVGRSFYGCSTYPRCRGTLDLTKEGAEGDLR